MGISARAMREREEERPHAHPHDEDHQQNPVAVAAAQELARMRAMPLAKWIRDTFNIIPTMGHQAFLRHPALKVLEEE